MKRKRLPEGWGENFIKKFQLSFKEIFFWHKAVGF